MAAETALLLIIGNPKVAAYEPSWYGLCITDVLGFWLYAFIKLQHVLIAMFASDPDK